LLDWAEALVLDGKVGLELIGARGVADVNYRVAADAMSTIYLIGRARSREEFNKALAIARAVKGVKKVVNYVVIRP
jgi:hyperosmotically inducible protein